MVFVLTALLIPPVLFLFCIIVGECEEYMNNGEKTCPIFVFVIMHKYARGILSVIQTIVESAFVL